MSFSPAAIARKVDSLNKLLEARTQLSNLITYMDGKAGAEELIAAALNDPALLKSLVDQAKPKTAANNVRGDRHGRCQTGRTAGQVAADADQFANLLQKQFKPKTDGARGLKSRVRSVRSPNRLCARQRWFPTTWSAPSRPSSPRSTNSSPTR